MLNQHDSIRSFVRLALLLTVMLIGLALPHATPKAQAQQVQNLVTLAVNVGYDGYFREGFWVPLLISVTNNADPINGKLIARQERSDALTNTFSTPISIANGARQTAFLYVTMKSFAQSLIVELMDDEGVIITDIQVPVRHLSPRDKLHIVVTSAANSAIDLGAVATAGNKAYQANWFASNVPDRAGALQAVDLLIFSDVDTGTLTAAQRRAINEWVVTGGHLIITGGANWQPTAAAFTNLLPLQPNETTPVENLSELAALGGDYTNALNINTIAASGQLTADAQVLAQAENELPLVARRQLGNGTVDYLTLDPSLEPLKSWDLQSQLWFSLLSSVDVRPSWAYGFKDVNKALDSVEILPKYSALPEITSMLGFLVLYILLVGPVNYLVLRRLNRREFAWITIPILIVVFSALAWSTGFNLRGNDVVLSRVSVVQSWSNQDIAYTEQVIGLLAPRRGDYTLSMNDSRLMRPAKRLDQSGRFFGNFSDAIEIEQGSTFNALDFPVDASFIAGFTTSGVLVAPQISGRINISYTGDGRAQRIQGAFRNDTELTLTDVVLLARGQVIRLKDPLKPGDLYVLNDTNLMLEVNGQTAASPIEYLYSVSSNVMQGYYSSRYYMYNYSSAIITPNKTSIDILGETIYVDDTYFYGFNPNNVNLNNTPEQRRRQKFLNSFVFDNYYSTARGNNIYLVGWTDQAPASETVGGANWRAADSTLYIVELETEITPPSTGRDTTITTDQFTWVAIERGSLLDAAPARLSINANERLAFRFTPLPDAILSEVNQLSIVLEPFDTNNNFLSQEYEIELWNWRTREWVTIEVRENKTPINNPQQFLGPLNAVQVRLSNSRYLHLDRIGVEQRGTLEAKSIRAGQGA